MMTMGVGIFDAFDLICTVDAPVVVSVYIATVRSEWW